MTKVPEVTVAALGNLAASVERVLRDTNDIKVSLERGSGAREIALMYTKLQEAQMWLKEAFSEMSDSQEAQEATAT